MERVLIVRLPDVMDNTWEDLRAAMERSTVYLSWLPRTTFPQTQTAIHVTEIIDITAPEAEDDYILPAWNI